MILAEIGFLSLIGPLLLIWVLLYAILLSFGIFSKKNRLLTSFVVSLIVVLVFTLLPSVFPLTIRSFIAQRFTIVFFNLIFILVIVAVIGVIYKIYKSRKT